MTAFMCPRCGMTSYNPEDAVMGYCGHCHATTAWTVPLVPTYLPNLEIKRGDAGLVMGRAGSDRSPDTACTLGAWEDDDNTALANLTLEDLHRIREWIDEHFPSA